MYNIINIFAENCVKLFTILQFYIYCKIKRQNNELNFEHTTYETLQLTTKLFCEPDTPETLKPK